MNQEVYVGIDMEDRIFVDQVKHQARIYIGSRIYNLFNHFGNLLDLKDQYLYVHGGKHSSVYLSLILSVNWYLIVVI